MRSVDPRTPVVVGAGQVVQRPEQSEARDPIALAVEALRLAGEDSGAGERLLRRADSVRHVATTGWPYRDEAALIAAELGASPRETARTTRFGGDGPQRLLGDTAQAIANGELDVALVSGAEAIATLRAAQRAGELPAWTDQPDDVEPTRTLGAFRPPSNEAEMAVGLMAPIYNYALLETAVRRRSAADPETHMRTVGSLWSRFSEVAAQNPYAWLPKAHTPQELIEPSEANRPISAPYLKLLTANIGVDQASGLILCSAKAAEGAGVPRDRWVFPWAGAHAEDEWFMSERDELASSPAIHAAGTAALEHAGIGIDDVSLIDLYSCFPSAVQIAAAELGLPTDDPARPLTVTGGLTFAGGPGNNHAGHAVATLTDRLREDPEAVGLATALGWYVTKHALGVYSATPPSRPFREIDADPLVRRPAPRRASAGYSGPAVVDAYTVPYVGDGTPEAAIVSALSPDGTRALVRSTDADAIDAILSADPLGHSVTVGGPDRIDFEHPVPIAETQETR
jgi:acetyl-CoA C-acetyltransferase